MPQDIRKYAVGRDRSTEDEGDRLRGGEVYEQEEYHSHSVSDREEYLARRQKTPEQALSALMRYSSRAERSSGDALRLMRRWGIGEADREKVLARLREMRFIDDRRFAEAYVRDKMRLGGWGPRKIRSGLFAKGIASDIAVEAMAALEGGADEGRLLDILRRKEPSVKGASVYERRAKLIRYGLSRGFGYEEVMAAAEKICLEP